jgi:hypothetical protein
MPKNAKNLTVKNVTLNVAKKVIGIRIYPLQNIKIEPF